jgi:hypothetical protein
MSEFRPIIRYHYNLAQLKHSNVRALTSNPTRTSIGARQIGQKVLSILLDVKQKSESDVGKLVPFARSNRKWLQVAVFWRVHIDSAHAIDLRTPHPA